MPINVVSVIIPVYNGLPEIGVQLEALAAQDYDGRYEVIISDNGSTDGLRHYLSNLDLHLDVRCIDSSDVRGAPHARNVGIDAAHGEFLAFTDHDDAVHPHWLSALTQAAVHHDAIGGAVEVYSLNTAEVATWRDLPHPEQRFSTFYLPYAQGNNFGMWRRVVDEIGYFDETLVGGGEDVDYSWRIQEAGLRLGHTPEAVVAYRLRTTVRSNFDQGLSYGRAAWPVVFKHGPQGCPVQPALLAVPAHLATILYLLTIKNPWLPKKTNQYPRGRWAHTLGMQCGSLAVRVSLVMRSLSR